MDNLISLFGDVYWETDELGRFTGIHCLSPFLAQDNAALQEAVGHQPWECARITVAPSTCQQLHQAISGRNPFAKLGLAWNLGATGLRRMCLYGHPRFASDGKFAGHRGVMQDVTDLKKEEDELRRFRIALEGSGDPIILIDRATMRIIDVNEAMCTSSGYSRSELLQMAPWDMLMDDPETVVREFDEVIAADDGKGIFKEGAARDRSGNSYVYELCRKAIRFDDRWIIVSIARDITRRRLAEDTAVRLGRMYATINGTNEAILHAATPEELFQQVCEVAVREGQILSASVLLPDPASDMAKFVAVAGMSAELLRTARISFNDNLPEGMGMVGTVFRTQRPCVSNDYLNDARLQPWHGLARNELIGCGAALPLVRNGQSIGVMLLLNRDKDGFEHDIIELLERVAQNIVFALDNLEREDARRKTDEALRASEEKYRTILENIEDAYYEVDLRGTLVMHNDAFARMFGYTPQEMVGMNYSRVHLPEDAREVFSHFNEVYRTGIPKKGIDWRWIHQSGRLLLCEGSIHLIRDGSGEPVGFRGILREVTERRRMENALRESEERFRDLTEMSSDWYWEQDSQFRFVQINGDVHAKTGIAPDSFLGRTLWDLDFDTVASDQWTDHRNSLAAGKPFNELILKSRPGAGLPRYLSISGLPRFDDSGCLTGYRGTGKDITEKMLSDQRIRHLASHDILTGLPNRMMFNQVLSHQIQQARRYGRRFALMFIDLDHFKEINDTLGHDAGDVLLKVTASRLVDSVRSSDFVARLAGDEFVVILPEIDRIDQIAAIAEKIVDSVRAPVLLADAPRTITASLGVCIYPDNGEDEEALLKHADAAMYRVKHSSKNDFQFFLQAG